MSLEEEVNKREELERNTAQEKVQSKSPKAIAKESQDCVGFGIDHEPNPEHQLMLTFRLLGGQAMSFPYSYLVNIHFDDKKSVIISYVSHTVTVEGDRLEELFKRLETWSVSFVEELEEKDRKPGKPFVKTISIEARQGKGSEEGDTTEGDE